MTFQPGLTHLITRTSLWSVSLCRLRITDHLIDQALQQVSQVHFEFDQVSGADGRLICGCPARGEKSLLLVFTGFRQSPATSGSFNSPATRSHCHDCSCFTVKHLLKSVGLRCSLNRPGFPRRSPCSLRNAFQTLLGKVRGGLF